jgi:hypothetical protein
MVLRVRSPDWKRAERLCVRSSRDVDVRVRGKGPIVARRVWGTLTPGILAALRVECRLLRSGAPLRVSVVASLVPNGVG